MQAYITRTLYHGEDSLGAQAQKASLEAKKLKEEGGGAGPAAPPRQARRSPEADAGGATPTAADAAAQGDGSKRPRPARRPAGPDVSHDERPEPVQEEEEAPLVEWVETTGKTVEEAKDAALDQLGCRRAGRRVRGGRGAQDRPVRTDTRRGAGAGPGAADATPPEGRAAGSPREGRGPIGPAGGAPRRRRRQGPRRAEAGGRRAGARRRRRAGDLRRRRRRTGPRAPRREDEIATARRAEGPAAAARSGPPTTKTTSRGATT